MTAPIVCFVLGYVIGSFPTAYLLVLWRGRFDVRGKGSGNVGALNAFETTGSKMVGAAVLLIDLAKGCAAVWLCSALFGSDFWIRGMAGFGAVAGHNYPAWLRFRGGRGLATAAGVLLLLDWPVVAVWCSFWLVLYAFSRNVHGSNVLASILTPLLAVAALGCGAADSGGRVSINIIVLMCMIFLLIILRHPGTFPAILKNFRKSA